MKSKLLLLTASLILLLSLLPSSTVSAAETEVWVLSERHFEPESRLKMWEQQFLDSVMNYKIHFTDSEFIYWTRVKKAGVITLEATFKFTFDFPEKLVPGEKATLLCRGTSSGKGNATETYLTLHAQKQLKDGKSNLADTAISLKGINSADIKSLEFIVPEKFDGEIIIRTGNNIDAATEIKWVYKIGKPKVETTTAKPPDDLPDWVKNGQMYVDEDGKAIYVPAWLEWMKPKRVISGRGMVEPKIGRDLWVYSRSFNKWKGPLSAPTTLYSGDIVRTGLDTDCRIWWASTDGAETIGCSIGRDTVVDVPVEENSGWPTLWSIYEGAVSIKHALLRQAPVYVEPRSHEVRTPTIAGGVRGSYCIVIQDQVTQTSTIYMISGEFDYYNMITPRPEAGLVTPGHKLQVNKDGTETITPFTNNEIEAVIDKYKLEEPVLLSQNELEALFDKSEKGAVSGFPMLPVIIVGVVIIVGGATFLVLKMRKKADKLS